jgi:exosortase
MQKQPTDGILEEFRIDFLECWQRLPNKGIFLILLGAWLALFQFLGNSTFGYIDSPSLLRWMSDVSGEGDRGLLVPAVVLGLFWWKRKELTALSLRAWWPGLVLVGGGLLLHILGYMIQQPNASILAMFIGLYGLMGLAWGPDWLRASFFPFILFLFAVPGLLAQPITFPLRLLVCRLVEVISGFILQIDVIREGTILRDPGNHFQYDVAAACSGIRSLVATLILAVSFAMLSFRTWWKRVLLMVLAFPLSVAGNVLRMLTIIIAAAIGGQEAGHKVHDSTIFSLLPYVPVFVVLPALGHWLRESESQRPKAVEREAQAT